MNQAKGNKGGVIKAIKKSRAEMTRGDVRWERRPGESGTVNQ
jgi:hypothetical protein